MLARLSRRDFLKLGVLGATTAVLAGCTTPRRWETLEPYVVPPEEQLNGAATWYASTCRQCPAACGIIVRILNGRAVKIEGNPEHPLNRGKLCPRGQAGLQLLYHPDRLAGPVQQSTRGTRNFKALAWDEALNALYGALQSAGGAVAVWAGSATSGHLIDLFTRYTKAVGARAPLAFDAYTGLQAYRTLRASNQALFGHDALPSYDLGHADLVFSFGADFLGTWLSTTRYGVEFGDFRSQASGLRGYLVQFEPRLSVTGAKADRWLPVRPGDEALVAQALVALIAQQGQGSAERVARARVLAGSPDLQAAASAAEISLDDLARLAILFATAARPLALPGAALAASGGAGALAAVQALNAVAGGAALLVSPTSPALPLARPAPASYADAQQLIERMRAGEIKTLLVHGANPAYDLPGQLGFADAVKNVHTVVSFAPLADETSALADLVLPDRTYLEGWGYEVVSPDFGVPIVSGQQPVVTPVFDARSTGDLLVTAARGIPAAALALPWPDEVAYLKETIGRLPPEGVGATSADVLWARFLRQGGWWQSAARPEALQPQATAALNVAAPQFQGDEQTYPYFLHLYLSPFLSDGRGASLPWLQGVPDPMTTLAWQTWVEIHPSLAQKLGVGYGDIVQVTSPAGQIEAPVYIYRAIRPDTAAIPIGQGHTDEGRYARDRGANPLQLLGAQPGPSGDLAWASVRVKLAPTGRHVPLAVFESLEGTSTGFINKDLPGQ